MPWFPTSAETSMTPCLDHYKTVRDFVAATCATMGNTDEFQKIREQHYQNLKSQMQRIPKHMKEAKDIQVELNKPTDAFTGHERCILATIVATSATSPQKAGSPDMPHNGQQSHQFMHNYLTASKWSVLTSDTSTMDECIHAMADAAFDANLRNPTEMSCLWMLATIIAAEETRRRQTTAVLSHKWLLDLKHICKLKRKTEAAPEGRPKIAVYPSSAEEFIEMDSDAYTDEATHFLFRQTK